MRSVKKALKALDKPDPSQSQSEQVPVLVLRFMKALDLPYSLNRIFPSHRLAGSGIARQI
jgi:hypothetical protein